MAENWIFFIDTNVYLDFYRLSGESAKRQLASLERHADKLITSEQVRMEFLKNRQKVISKALSDLKAPNNEGIPQIFSESRSAKSLSSARQQATKRFKELKTHAIKFLDDPSRYDEVYKTFNRIYRKDTRLTLSRSMKVRYEIRNLARKRFILGYPPRKQNDTSIGDAVNWEWIIRCAQTEDGAPHVMIVSRDGDYGATIERKTFLNDWLRREFKERLGKNRKIELTDSLTNALKRMGELVKKEDESEEDVILSKQLRQTASDEKNDTLEKILSRLLGASANVHLPPTKDDDDTDIDDLI